jgi:hypothetical protein
MPVTAEKAPSMCASARRRYCGDPASHFIGFVRAGNPVIDGKKRLSDHGAAIEAKLRVSRIPSRLDER